MPYEAAAASHPGLCRARNEDSYAFHLDPGGDGGDFFVADGVGGAPGGEIASRIASEAALAIMKSQARERLRDAFAAANEQVYSRAQTQPALRGMGTTLVGLSLRGDRASIGNVGDSRCYRLRRRHFECMTEDHSFVAGQIRSGRLTPEAAERSPWRSVITRSIGSHSEVEPDLIELEVEAGDLFMLTTDGLTRELEDASIAGILAAGGQPFWLCAKLIEQATLAGGRDNVTCIVIRR